MSREQIIKLLIICSIIISFISLCGCVDEKEKNKEKEIVLDTDGDGFPDDEDVFPDDPTKHDIILKKTSLPTRSGWAESNCTNNSAAPCYVNTTIPIKLNHTWVASISVTIKIEDYDEAHSETDEDSDPDMVYAKLISENIESSSVNGYTPCILSMNQEGNTTGIPLEYKGLPKEWYIELTAVCYGKVINHPLTFMFKRVKDQGVAWELDVEYEYYESI